MKGPARTINEVLDLSTGEEIRAEEFFLRPIDEIFKQRDRQQSAFNGYQDPELVCYYCKQVVAIRGGKPGKNVTRKTTTLHFAHFKDSDECHIKTKNKLSHEQIQRIKYNGAKEGSLHIRLKDEIAFRLRQNEKAGKGVTNVMVEQVIKSEAISKEWKKPDINALFQGKRLVVELQLSTTFLSEINKRQHFYQTEGLYILWVFHRFDLIDEIRRFTDNDVIYTNHQNAFVFDKESLEMSKAANDLVLKCFYNTYFREGLDLRNVWESTFVTLADLKFDDNFKLYYHDSDSEKAKVLSEIAAHQATILEEQSRKAEADEKARMQQQARLERIWELTNEIELAKEEYNKYEQELLKSQPRLQRIKEKLGDIDAVTSRVVRDLASEVFSVEEFAKPLEGTYRLKLKEAIRKIWEAEKQEVNASSALRSIESLATVSVGGVNYRSIPIERFDFIKANAKKIKILYKSAVDDLFGSNELRTFSENEIVNFQYNKNVYFLCDYNSRIEELNALISESEKRKVEYSQTQRALTEEIKQQVDALLRKEYEELFISERAKHEQMTLLHNKIIGWEEELEKL